MQTLFSLWLRFLRLGLTSFGGPVAHLGFFHDEFVVRRQWLSERRFADLVAFCQFLPGPASSQVGMGIGYLRAGIPGAVVAWLGFTLPSAFLLILFAHGVSRDLPWLDAGTLAGLKVAAVAVVAQALWNMGQKLCPDRRRATIAVLSAVFVSVFPSPFTQVLAILIAGVMGYLMLKPDHSDAGSQELAKTSNLRSAFTIALLLLTLIFLPLLAKYFDDPAITVFDSFFRTGSLVFGGGHVVLPLIENEVVAPGWVSKDSFMAGYGAAQAVPGPLFTFAAFLGAAMPFFTSPWLGGALTTVAIFLPSFLLLVGLMPLWERLQTANSVRSALLGINAAVVGLLLAAFYNPVWTSGVHEPATFGIAITLFLMLQYWKFPSWAVVAASAAAGYFTL